MPTYTATSPQGQTLHIEGDAPPTEKELDDIFARMAPPDRSADPYSAAPNTPAPPTLGAQFSSPAEFQAAQQRQATENPESLSSKAGMAAQALGSATAKVGLPAAAVALSPFTGGASLAAIGGLSSIGGEYLGNKIAGEESTPGGLAAAGVLGATPLRALGSEGFSGIAREAGKLGLAGLGANVVQTGIDEQRLPTGAEALSSAGLSALGAPMGRALELNKVISPFVRANNEAVELKTIQNSVRDQTLADARAAGYVVPPSKINPSAINNLVESFAGKAATGQEAAIRNQEITNALAKKAIGAPVDAPLTEQVLKDVRAEASLPYKEIAAISPQAAKDLEKLKDVRWDAKDYWKSYERSAQPSDRKMAVKLDAQADQLENFIEAQAKRSGQPGLVSALRKARVQIAKSYEVEKALNLGDANVSAPTLARSIGKLTDELDTIARFNKAFPTYSRLGSGVPPSGVSKLRTIAPALFGGAGAATFGPVGAAAALIPLGEGPVRGAVLSSRYAKYLGQPTYGNPLPDLPAQIARFGTAQAGRPSQ